MTRYWLCKLRFLSFCGMVVICVSALAACSGTSSSKTATGNSLKTATNNSPGLTSLTIALPTNTPDASPVYLASQLGYFRKNGINAKIVILASDTSDNSALIAGSVQYISSGIASLINADEKGIPMQDICTEYDGPAFALIVSKNVVANDHVTADMSLTQLLHALKGKKIALLGGAAAAPGLILTGLLKESGLPPNWLTIVNVSSAPALGSAFRYSEVDAVLDSQPLPDQIALENPGSEVVFNTTSLPNLATTPWEGIFGDRSYIAAHPALDRGICKSIAEADNFLLNDKGVAEKDLQATFSTIKPSLLATALGSDRWAPDAGMTSAQWTAAAKTLTALGIIKAPSEATLRAAYSTAYLP